MSAARLPSPATVARVQLNLLLQSKYLLTLGLIVSVMGAFLYRRNLPATPWMPPLISHFTFAFVALGGFAAVLVWLREAPQNRRYHWSLPVAREIHDMLRISAGAVWLVLSIGFFCILAWLATPAIHREVWLQRAPWFWFGLFAVPLLAYLLVTIPALLAGRPMVWVLTALLTGIVLASGLTARYAPPLYKVGSALFSFHRPPSLGVAFTGGERTAQWADGAEVFRVFKAHADRIYADDANRPIPLRPADEHMRRFTNFVRPYPLRGWLTALALWYGVALLGISLALARRPNI